MLFANTDSRSLKIESLKEGTVRFEGTNQNNSSFGLFDVRAIQMDDFYDMSNKNQNQNNIKENKQETTNDSFASDEMCENKSLVSFVNNNETQQIILEKQTYNNNVNDNKPMQHNKENEESINDNNNNKYNQQNSKTMLNVNAGFNQSNDMPKQMVKFSKSSKDKEVMEVEIEESMEIDLEPQNVHITDTNMPSKLCFIVIIIFFLCVFFFKQPNKQTSKTNDNKHHMTWYDIKIGKNSQGTHVRSVNSESENALRNVNEIKGEKQQTSEITQATINTTANAKAIKTFQNSRLASLLRLMEKNSESKQKINKRQSVSIENKTDNSININIIKENNCEITDADLLQTMWWYVYFM